MMMMMMMACDGYNQQQSLNYAPLISVVVQQSSCQARGGGGMKRLSSPHSSLRSIHVSSEWHENKPLICSWTTFFFISVEQPDAFSLYRCPSAKRRRRNQVQSCAMMPFIGAFVSGVDRRHSSKNIQSISDLRQKTSFSHANVSNADEHKILQRRYHCTQQ